MAAYDLALPPAPLLEMMRQAVIATDAGGSIVAWNAFAESLYGWRCEEVIGRRFASFLPVPGQVSRVQMIYGVLRRGESWGGQFNIRKRDGGQLEVFAIAAPVMDGSRIEGIVTISTPLPSLAEWPQGIDHHDTLTPREIEIATLTADGKATAEIAAQLRVSVRTVESHRFNIYRKLGVRNRAELMTLALRRGVFR